MRKRTLLFVSAAICISLVCAVGYIAFGYDTSCGTICVTLNCYDEFYPCLGKSAGAKCYNCGLYASKTFCAYSPLTSCNYSGTVNCGDKSESICTKPPEFPLFMCVGGMPSADPCLHLNCAGVQQ